jgi:subtilase family serine protease
MIARIVLLVCPLVVNAGAQELHLGSNLLRTPLAGPGAARPAFWLHAARSIGPLGLMPAQVRHFYGFDQISNGGDGQIIGIIDAYDDPHAEADLGVFSTQFGLPACTEANGCFRKIAATPYRLPRLNTEWALEMSLDIQWAHAIAPKAKILLVEASTNSFYDLMTAVDVAVANHVSVVSMSFGGPEFSMESFYNGYFSAPHVTFVASSGDSGEGVQWPAASPYVVGVGGTDVQTDGKGDYIGETAWSGSGGGISQFEMEPSEQSELRSQHNGRRGVPDVAYNANPLNGFAVYDSEGYKGYSGWMEVGGTSAGAPQWSAMFAIANSLRVALGKNPIQAVTPALLSMAPQFEAQSGPDFHDIVSGTNGNCGPICTAGVGYDYVTGLGSPLTPVLVPALVDLP